MKKIFLTIFLILIFGLILRSQVRIKMDENRGVYSTTCTVNGLRLSFIFDTGASNVSISLTEAVFMLKNGYLEESDLHGSTYSELANGKIIENTLVNLREIEIGGIVINNVEANIIHELSASLLLGQSAIQKLGKLQIDGNELLILEHDISQEYNAVCYEANNLIIEAEEHYFNNYNALAASIYQKAYNICSNVFNDVDLYYMASAYYFKEDFESAIKYYKMLLEKPNTINNSYVFFHRLAKANMLSEDYINAEIYFEKAHSKASTFEEKLRSNESLAELHFKMKNYQRSIYYDEKARDLYLEFTKFDIRKAIEEGTENTEIGRILYNIGIAHERLGNRLESEWNIYAAKLFGYLSAIDYCRKYNIKFDHKWE